MHAGDSIDVANSRWEFKGHVVEQFDDHITKSVPLYSDGHSLILILSDFFVRDNSVCYDIGCSTGRLSYMLATRHDARRFVRVIGIEKEEDMVKHAKRQYQAGNLEFCCEDIANIEFEKSQLIISYYTLQFVEHKHRQAIVNRIYESLEKGAAFLMFEKVTAINSILQDVLNTAYFDFKVNNGYTYEEILAKAFSLKGVLMANTTEKNIELLTKAGFQELSVIMKYCNFEGYIAIK